MLSRGFLLYLFVTILIGRLSAAALRNTDPIFRMDTKTFFSQPLRVQIAFFSNIENILLKCRVTSDQQFFLRIPIKNDPIASAIEKAFNNISHEIIAQILQENNLFAMQYVLGTFFPNLFYDWQHLRLDQIRPDLICRFPIENMPVAAFEKLPTEGAVICIKYRLEARLMTRFQSVVLDKASPALLEYPTLRYDFRFRLLFSSFLIGDTTAHKIIPHSDSASLHRFNVNLIYDSKMSNILGLILDSSPLDTLADVNPINVSEYAHLYNYLVGYYYILQTYLHGFVTGEIIDKTLIELICFKVCHIRALLSNRLGRFPAETDSVSKLYGLFSMCFSKELHKQAGRVMFNGFFNNASDLQFVGPKNRFSLVSSAPFGLDTIYPEEMLFDIFMTVGDETVEPDSQLLVQVLQSSFLDPKLEKFLNPIFDNINILNSLARFFQRYQTTTKKLYSSFNSSRFVSFSMKRNLENIMEESNYYLNQMKVNDIDFSDSVKFSTLFAGAFVTSASGSTLDTSSLPNFKKLGASFGIHAQAGIRSEKKRSLEDSFPRPHQPLLPSRSISSITFSLPELGMVLSSEPVKMDTKEYDYVSYLLSNLPIDRLDPEISVQVGFIESMLRLFSEVSKSPWCKISLGIVNSKVSGDGILADSLASFGSLVALPRFKTLSYVEELDGYVPAPLLDITQMYYMGVWTMMCLRYDVALPWSFAPIYREFLFSPMSAPISEVQLDQLINRLYDSLLKNIQFSLDSGDIDMYGVLPLKFRSCRMFSFPNAHGHGPSSKFPFSFENRFLEMVQTIPSYSNSLLTHHIARENIPSYIQSLKIALKRHLLDGRAMFMQGFSLFIKAENRPYLNTKYINGFISGRHTTPEELYKAIVFSGRGQGILVIDDFSGGSGSPMEPLEMMWNFIMRMTPDQIKSFLWFVTGSSLTRLNTIDSRSISFSMKVASETKFYSTVGVCFYNLTVVIHNNSAQQTFEKFIEAVTSSAGFVKIE